jgi:hypothetical protein
MNANVGNDDEQHCSLSFFILIFVGVKEDDECSCQVWRLVHVTTTNSRALFVIILFLFFFVVAKDDDECKCR